ncbi:metallophosphoesterase [Thermoplasmatales archaeon SW_10_69_26]|nr:MAG: metallophosphoesterase [Thermoplasmatales archaeon SW_10_69_26]
MRVALLSDVHSNVHALRAVLDDIDRVAPDEIAFLGDAVGYNAHPGECLELLRERCGAMVLGNHDEAVVEGGEELFTAAARAGVEHSRDRLDAEAMAFLREVPRQTEIDGIHLVHGSPRGPTTEYVFPDTHPESLQQIVDHPSVGDAALVAMGHTHVPFVRDIDGLTVLNVGSVGQPRDGDPRPCWALVDTDGPEVEIRRVEYDIEAAVADVRKADLPARTATRLYEGR